MWRPRVILRPVLSAFVALVLTGAGVGLAPSRAGDGPVTQRAVPGAASPAAVLASAAMAIAPADSLALALSAAAPDLDRSVLDLALRSQANAIRQGLVRDPSTLTVIDYSRPSVEPRFFVFDLATRSLVFEELVAHGKNSGANLATRFSNRAASLETSLGLYVTLDTYMGEHGRSLRLEGLEPGFNDQALARGIVIHAAGYVSPDMAARYGRLGRSWGCPALPPAAAQSVIDRIRGGSAVFAYYPDRRWLRRSRFLGDGQALAALAPGPERTRLDS